MTRRILLACLLAALCGSAFPSIAAADRTVFKAQFVCNDRGHVFPLAGARVELRKRGWSILPKWFDDKVLGGGHLDGDGRVQFTVTGDEDDLYYRVLLEDGNGVRAEDWYATWPWLADTPMRENDVPVQDYGTVGLGNGSIPPECAAWEGARQAYHGYWDEIGERPPYGNLKINVNSPSGGQPFVHYTTIHWPPRHPPSGTPGKFTTSFHEFAHTVRHAFDGSAGHFYDDVVDFKYLQHHDACKLVSSSAFAFNEGWAEYWAGSWAPAPNCEGLAPDNYRVEGNVAAALKGLEVQCPNVERPQMVDVLRRNPGRIHSFADFERALGCRLKSQAELAREAEERKFRNLWHQAGKLQVAGARRAIRKLGRVRVQAVKEAKRALPCPPTPCTLSLQRKLAPVLLGVELAQARLVHRTIRFMASARALKRMGKPQTRGFHRKLALRRVALRRGTARAGVKALRRARIIAAPFLRKDPTPEVAQLGRALQATLATFRAGRLPSALTLQTPASAGVAPAPEWMRPLPPPPPPDPTPAPSPTPEPTPAPLPDLVVDSVGAGDAGAAGFQWHVTVRNAGEETAPPSTTWVLRENAGTIEIATPELAPGASTTVKAECPYGSVAQGTGRADGPGQIAESDESNNDRVSGQGGTGGRCRYP